MKNIEGEILRILYSAGTKLAYLLNQKFYGGLHYVWCAPAPDSDSVLGGNPPTSDPWQICMDLAEHVRRADKHSSLIANNRGGLIRGASAREQQGLITSDTRKLIEEIVNAATFEQFKPLFMVMAYDDVKGLVQPVAIAERATALSQEFVIADLPRANFDVWEWKI